jgi:hypothetical protein
MAEREIQIHKQPVSQQGVTVPPSDVPHVNMSPFETNIKMLVRAEVAPIELP